MDRLKQSITDLESNPRLQNELQRTSEMISKLRSQLSHSEGERLRLETRLKEQLAHTGDPSLPRHSTPISRSRAHRTMIDDGSGTCNITSKDTSHTTNALDIAIGSGRASSSAISDGSLPPLVSHGNNQRGILKKKARASLSADGIPQTYESINQLMVSLSYYFLSSKYSESEVEEILTRVRVGEVERDRLLELTKMLQQRCCN